MVNQARLKELLYYHPGSGVFVWAVSRGRCAAGTQAGTVDGKGYLQIRVDGKFYRAHRLAVLYMTGVWPVEEVDHANRVKLDNSWDNLGAATHIENSFNRGVRSDSLTGLKLIGWNKRTNRYRVRSKVEGKQKEFGTYRTLPEAIEAAAQVMLTYHGDFARAA